MKLCMLCQKNDADKTGSHLIPSFLLKMVENYDGSTKRDRGIGFRLTAENTEVHFERSVSGEKITELMGELPEEELRRYPSPSIRDHIYCGNCENFFGNLEGAYAPTLTKHGDENYPSTADSRTATLFWLSIFWRASSAGTYGFSLKEKQQEQLRSILAHYAETCLKAEQPAALKYIRYKIVRSINFAQKLTGFIVFDPVETAPYCAVIGEYAAFLYFDDIKDDDLPGDFFGFEKILYEAEINCSTSGEKILSVDEGIFVSANESLALKISQLKTGYIEGLIVGTAKFAFGFTEELPTETIKAIAMKIPEADKPSGKKYDKREMIELIVSELTAYFESPKTGSA